MKTTKMINGSGRVPLIAALPYSISYNEFEIEVPGSYDPVMQLSYNISNRWSTCSYDESAGGLFSSKRDTKKDD